MWLDGLHDQALSRPPPHAELAQLQCRAEEAGSLLIHCPAAHARNEALRAPRHYARAFWKRWTRYHARRRIAAKMRCLKSFGERIAARDPDRQTAETHIRIALMNRFSALGTAEIFRVA